MRERAIASLLLVPVLAACEPLMSVPVVEVMIDQKFVDGLKDEKAKANAQSRIDSVKENCEKNVDGYIPGTEMSLLVSKPDGTTFGYGFCNAEFEDGTVGTVVDTGGTGVVFVTGDLTVDIDLTIDAAKNEFFMANVKGNITVEPTVIDLQGIYLADGDINISGANAAALNIQGSLYTLRNINLTRSFTNRFTNNSTPAVNISYRPDLLFNLPPGLLTAISVRY